jgi:hypothetical protein
MPSVPSAAACCTLLLEDTSIFPSPETPLLEDTSIFPSPETPLLENTSIFHPPKRGGGTLAGGALHPSYRLCSLPIQSQPPLANLSAAFGPPEPPLYLTSPPYVLTRTFLCWQAQAKLAPCIIFVDEVDALLGRREGGEHEALREMKNEFMQQWDGVRRCGPKQRVTVLGATNRPQDLDEAVLRRFGRRVFVQLPDVSTRAAVLGVLLQVCMT